MYLIIQWHHLKAKPLKSITNITEETSNLQNWIVVSIHNLNLEDPNINNCKDPQSHENLVQHLLDEKFVQHHFHLLQVFHINKTKALIDQHFCLEVVLVDEDIVMTLLKSLSASYKFLVNIMKSMSMKKLAMDCVTARFMYKKFKCR